MRNAFASLCNAVLSLFEQKFCNCGYPHPDAEGSCHTCRRRLSWGQEEAYFRSQRYLNSSET